MWKAAFIAVFILLVYNHLFMQRSTDGVHIDGEIAKGWKRVYSVFRKNLEENWERDGGAFVVYHKGVKVVDIWGGYADRESERKWKKDTLSLAFSCSKAMGSLVVAKLVDEGRINYDDLVVSYWPEFGENGKANVTVRWLITHMAGLAYLDHPITLDMGLEAIEEALARQYPNWPPGEGIGYHAITHGWLVNALVRRADRHQRSVGEYFKQEIADKYGIEFFMSLPISEQYRMARLSNPSIWNTIDEIMHSPSDFNILRYLRDRRNNGSLSKVEATTPWIQFMGGSLTLNDPDLHRIEQSAVMGCTTVRAMAEVFELLRSGQLVSEGVRQQLVSDYVTMPDIVSGATVPRGQGLMLKEFEQNGQKIKLYGHSGYGGQNIRTDFENQITISYVSNGLKVGFGDTARTYKRLLKAVYDVIIPKNAAYM